MLLLKLKHKFYVAMMKATAGLTPTPSNRAFVGNGSSAQLCSHIARTGARKILVVTDKPLREAGVVDRAIAALAGTEVDVAIFDGVLPDPNYDQVAAGVAAARQYGSEVVLAVGGGSAIDAAKIIAASVTSDEDPRSWVGFGKVKHELLKLYAIPTTSGTGSEATMGAVITDPQTHQKGIISGGTLMPAAVALDPELITGLPPHITAATGMDALTHAIEAYIGTWEKGTRREDSRMAVKLIFDNLPRAYRDGSDLAAREGMCFGAYYAGLAINQVNVGSVHAIAHQLGGKYGIPHGLANALVLPHVLDFCREEAREELAELALLIGLGSDGDDTDTLAYAFIEAVRNLRTDVGIPDYCDQLRREDYDELIERALVECASYPVPRLLDRNGVDAILTRISS